MKTYQLGRWSRLPPTLAISIVFQGQIQVYYLLEKNGSTQICWVGESTYPTWAPKYAQKQGLFPTWGRRVGML